MQVPSSLKSVPWRAVVGLLLAGLLGWLLAWFVIPSGPAPTPGAAAPASPAARAPVAPAASAAALPSPDGAPRLSLEQLLQKQDQVSAGAARSAASPSSAATGLLGAAPGVAGAKPATAAAKEAERARRMKAMQELQITALADIQAVKPGDINGLMAAMGRFDAQLQATGAPPLIDMDNLRKMLEGTQRVQRLSSQLIAESEKGRAADPNKVNALSAELRTAQAALPRQIIKADALKKQMAP